MLAVEQPPGGLSQLDAPPSPIGHANESHGFGNDETPAAVSMSDASASPGANSRLPALAKSRPKMKVVLQLELKELKVRPPSPSPPPRPRLAPRRHQLVPALTRRGDACDDRAR